MVSAFNVFSFNGSPLPSTIGIEEKLLIVNLGATAFVCGTLIAIIVNEFKSDHSEYSENKTE